MTEELRLAAFLAARPRLLRLAYRYLQTVSEAEDVVQDCWLRFSAAAIPDDCESYLARIVTRLCLDRLKSATHRRETYVGPWLPEPLAGATEPAGDTALDISFAVMRALETLSPLERAALFLHDLFDVPFEEIAETLDRSPAACRQLAARARKSIRQDGRRFAASRADVDRFVDGMENAIRTGDLAPLQSLLTADIELVSDGGGKALAARNILRGADAVSRFLLGVSRFVERERLAIEPATINGAPGLLILIDGAVNQTMSFAVDDAGAVTGIYAVRNPDKLEAVRAAAGGGPGDGSGAGAG